MVSLPRIVITAPASGQGKTTVAVGIMAALTAAGHRVAPAKVGPDYIDPGYHALATGRAGRNLDPWLVDESMLAPLLLHGFLTPTPADVAVIEGAMGLFDGRIGTDGFASTAHVAKLTQSPVVVVVDVSSAARTVAAVVHGLRTYDRDVQLVGVILNKSGSPRHSGEVRRAVEALGLPVLGDLPRDAGVSAPSRHLGLVPAAERPGAAAALALLADQASDHVDLSAILDLARDAVPLDVPPWSAPVVPRGRPRVVAVAGGRAFTFRYAETEELLRAAGCEPVTFDPATDDELPSGTSGLYLGGGFPEVHAASLAGNGRLLSEIRSAVAAGMPTVAECAGLLYLTRSVEGHPFVGAVPAEAVMHPRLTLRYSTAVTTVDTLLGPAGTRVRGHEFHRTRVSPEHGAPPAWFVDGRPEGFALDPAHTGVPSVHASYLHVHWAGNPAIAAHFADSVHAFDSASRTAVPHATSVSAPPCLKPPVRDPAPLDHHGDQELGPGLVDFAVNVRLTEPPPWLAHIVAGTAGSLASYPSTDRARNAIASRHQVPESMVLPTSGGAEAFTLIARGIQGRRPLIVHPQFTEPESALRRAGRPPERLLLEFDSGFALRSDAVTAAADLVFVGNPTNPTGVLHSRRTLNALRTAGRTLIVDEAFMDAVPGEPETLIGLDMDGVLVLRSLTKIWGIAGLRAGYVIGDPALIELLHDQQPPWSVSTPAAAAMEAVMSPAALAETHHAAQLFTSQREHLVLGLEGLGLAVQRGQAPFVLVRVPAGTREALRDRGVAVRRGDTFPGLGPQWIRISVREAPATDLLLSALGQVLASCEGGSA